MKNVLASLAVFGLVLTFGATGVAAARPDKTDGFVCPTITSDAVGKHNPQAVEIGGGDYTIAGPEVSVPLHATNGDGEGTPGGDHSAPGDTDYTAVWAGN